MSQDDVVNLFKESGALLTGHFKLTSGRHSDVYYEKFTLLKQPALCTRLCARMADTLRTTGVRTIVGPTTGGIILAYDVARYLGVEAIYAEAADDGKGRVFKQGFHLEPGQKVAIVDDVLTTGTSVDEVIALVRRYGAEIVGLRLMLDRSNGKVRFDYPFAALATVAAESWDPAECPLCAKAMPLTQRGSRKF
ncbi:MAG TPA: orotate phosphoribosyltransferase [candidate division Zixibacteria bacterium]|nr:orotate phosphoribosyltransferase [candidate division Zixibacteria bacterium]